MNIVRIPKVEQDFISLSHLNPKKASAITIQPITRFKFDAAIIFSDILIIPWALNRNVRFKPGIGPLLTPMSGPSDLDIKCLDSFTTKFAPVGEAVRITRLSLPAETALIGFAGAPWTLITYMAEGQSSRDFLKARLWAWQHKKSLEKLIEVLVEVTISFYHSKLRTELNV